MGGYSLLCPWLYPLQRSNATIIRIPTNTPSQQARLYFGEKIQFFKEGSIHIHIQKKDLNPLATILTVETRSSATRHPYVYSTSY